MGICFLSQYQGTPEEIDLQVKQGSNSIESGVFATILRSVKAHGGRMHIVPCEELMSRGGLYSRLWCAWEVFNAIELGLRIFFDDDNARAHWYMDVTYGDQVMKEVERKLFGDADFFDARSARCGNPNDATIGADEMKIREAVHASATGWMGSIVHSPGFVEQ